MKDIITISIDLEFDEKGDMRAIFESKVSKMGGVMTQDIVNTIMPHIESITEIVNEAIKEDYEKEYERTIRKELGIDDDTVERIRETLDLVDSLEGIRKQKEDLLKLMSEEELRKVKELEDELDKIDSLEGKIEHIIKKIKELNKR